jgi:hypothetical protein
VLSQEGGRRFSFFNGDKTMQSTDKHPPLAAIWGVVVYLHDTEVTYRDAGNDEDCDEQMLRNALTLCRYLENFPRYQTRVRYCRGSFEGWLREAAQASGEAA